MDDLGMFEYNNAHDLFKKLKYDFEILSEEVTSNNYFNFILVACHLYDWLKFDERYPREFRESSIKKLEEGNYYLFLDIANRSKHFKLDRKRKTISKDEYIPGFDFNNIDFNKLNFGGPIYEVEQDGVLIDLYNECEKIFKIYELIFR